MDLINLSLSFKKQKTKSKYSLCLVIACGVFFTLRTENTPFCTHSVGAELKVHCFPSFINCAHCWTTCILMSKTVGQLSDLHRVSPDTCWTSDVPCRTDPPCLCCSLLAQLFALLITLSISSNYFIQQNTCSNALCTPWMWFLFMSPPFRQIFFPWSSECCFCCDGVAVTHSWGKVNVRACN